MKSLLLPTVPESIAADRHPAWRDSGSWALLPLSVCGLAMCLSGIAGADEGVTAPGYNSEVRAILSNHCFRCHGPDDKERKAKLRLDVPGHDVDFAEVLSRITSDDVDELMPPLEANKPLTAKQIDTLRRWIDAGARYEQHWAYVPPVGATIPERASAIDYFIGRKLQTAGIETTAPPADPLTLVRRVYLDLIGLPPTPEEADTFVNDTSDNAYAQLVDQLLASQHYGERWARRWLDLARYADTNGYEKDRDRNIWPYRDWVIRAINEDMPFDQFTIEQIAGDMLPDATPSQHVATGFHRNTMLNEEGGIDPLEFRFHAMTDRVATTGTTWLGLTISCAQCHTHKYDPITHSDYYGMMAYLNNTDEPDYRIPAPNTRSRSADNAAKAEQLLAELPDRWPLPDGDSAKAAAGLADAAFQSWLQTQRESAIDWSPMEPDKTTANHPYLVHEGEGIIFAGGDTSKHDIYSLSFTAGDQPITALRLEALPDERLPDRGPGTTFYEGRKGDFYLTEFIPSIGDRSLAIAHSSETYAQNRFGNNPVSARLATDGDIQTGWSVAGRVGERHVAVFVLAEPVPAGQSFAIEMHFGRHYASSLGKFRISSTAAPAGESSPSASELPADIAALLARPAESLTKPEMAKLREEFLMQAPELKEQADRIRQLREPVAGTLTMVMRERPSEHSRPTFRHNRGEYLSPREEVSPHLPEALYPADQSPPTDRLGFARWLVSRDNPLTARVIANRQWAAFFGTGIVQTQDDFGMQGTPPTHPELLDWLALYLMDHDWSMKALHREIVLSEAYRRATASPGTPAANAPREFLASFPRTRLEAEIIRDSALRAAGILDTAMFGAPVRPPQPGGVTEVAYGSPKWTPSDGGNRFRRSVYTYQKRTAPFAMFTTFDGGSGESCLAKRDISNTPLQALTLMNDPMFIEIAEKFGSALAGEPGSDRDRIRLAFRRVLTRPPSESELTRLLDFHEKHRDWPALARVLLNLDEAISKP
ncbi:MAG: PSD1 domain-containing protein [Verrucomicrobiae bacterium]|nr:PSD1 domain-containing protein [Verrucomicrobiae bacterium]